MSISTNNFSFIEQEQLEKMTKKELISYIHELEAYASQRKVQKSNKKNDVLDIIQNHQPISRQEIADMMNISVENTSSLLTYLRKDGYKIGKNHEGNYFIMN